MLSETRSAPRVSHAMRTLVGELQSTGVRGPMSDTKLGPGTGGADVVVLPDESGRVVVDDGGGPAVVVVVELVGAVVEDDAGGPFAWWLLLHPARSITAAIATIVVRGASETDRAGRTLRS